MYIYYREGWRKLNLIVESNNLEEYLCETEEVDFMHESIQKLVAILFNENQSEVEKISIAYEFVRDEITHSWDAQNPTVTEKLQTFYNLRQVFAMQNLIYWQLYLELVTSLVAFVTKD